MDAGNASKVADQVASRLVTRGKPSTWFPRGRHVETTPTNKTSAHEQNLHIHKTFIIYTIRPRNARHFQGTISTSQLRTGLRISHNEPFEACNCEWPTYIVARCGVKPRFLQKDLTKNFACYFPANIWIKMCSQKVVR